MLNDPARKAISDKLLAFMDEPLGRARGEEGFSALALEVFAYQFARNPVYARFCQGRSVTPANVKRWQEIPAVPTTAFKELPIACFPAERAAAVYESSGTTGTKRSKHYLSTLELYEASLKPNFQAHLLRDGARLPMLILALPPRLAPKSSLTHMLEIVMGEWGAEGSRYYLDERGLQRHELLDDLRRFQRAGEAVALLGITFAFVHFIDHCLENKLTLHMPPGSRIMDTGGYKGRSREVPKEELYRLYGAVFGVPWHHVVNEYGMTEMSSQFYDTDLFDFVSRRNIGDSLLSPGGREPALSPSKGVNGEGEPISGSRHKIGPPWTRTLVIDPETMLPARPGAIGLLRHFDLANLDSAMAIQTDDLGREIGGGFEILGRAKGAEARGCSLAVDELLSQAKES